MPTLEDISNTRIREAVPHQKLDEKRFLGRER